MTNKTRTNYGLPTGRKRIDTDLRRIAIPSIHGLGTDWERTSGRGATALSRIYKGVSPRGEPTNRGVCPRAGCGLRPNRFPSMAERSGWQTQHGRTHYGRDEGVKPHSVPPATDTCDRNHTIPSPIHRHPTPRDHCMARPSA